MADPVPTNFSSPLTGNEILRAYGLDATGRACGEDFLLTSAQIAALAGSELPVVTGIIANSAGTQAAATVLTLGAFNNVTTVGGSGYGVKLPASYVGATAVVSNQGANAAKIFGTSPDTINGVATATGISIPVGAIFVFTCAVAGNWLQNVQTGGAFTGTFDGVLGGNTPAASHVTTLVASSTASTTALTATATSNQLVLGTTRTLTLTAPTPASSSRTVTLPDPGGSDSVVYLALAQTLLAKTLTSPILNTPAINNAVTVGPAPTACGSTLAVTAALANQTILLNTAGGSVATLPAATGTGNKYRFVVSTTATSAAHKILAASGSDYINGNASGQNGNTVKQFSSASATNHSIQMPFAGTQPSGGFIGDQFDFQDIATNLWQCTGVYQAGTTPTTPFSTATS